MISFAPLPTPLVPARMWERLEREHHAWIMFPDEHNEETANSAAKALLSPVEINRYQRYRRAQDRLLFLVAHAGVRSALSHYGDISAKDWDFSTSPQGRPEIANKDAPPGLRFNLSHTAGMAVVLVHRDKDAGVDVERLHRVKDLTSMSKMVFSPEEQADFASCSQAEQPERFLRYWTLKEAYTKARGMGLKLPLQEFSFELGHSPEFFPPRISFAPGFPDSPQQWHFLTTKMSGTHFLAIATREKKQPPGAALFFRHPLNTGFL